MRWDPSFETECDRLVGDVCDAAGPRERRTRAWQALVGRIGPFVEAWSRKSPILRQAGLAGLYAAPLALVRPDQYVAWRGASADPADLIDTIRGRARRALPDAAVARRMAV